MMRLERVSGMVLGRPWAILPQHYRTMCEIVVERMTGSGAAHAAAGGLSARLRGVPAAGAAAGLPGSAALPLSPWGACAEGVRFFDNRFAAPLDFYAGLGDGEDPSTLARGYLLHEGVAVIPVHGVLSKRAAWMMEYSGGASTELTGVALDAALGDGRARVVLLDIDSPGGDVDGSFELAEKVYAARGLKPVVGFGNGMLCSAAYLLGSACEHVTLTETGYAGSIGVIMAHHDFSAADKLAGLNVEYIISGEFKKVGNEHAALSGEEREYLQGLVDETYGVFVAKVARNRRLGADAVRGTEAR